MKHKREISMHVTHKYSTEWFVCLKINVRCDDYIKIIMDNPILNLTPEDKLVVAFWDCRLIARHNAKAQHPSKPVE